MSLTFIRSFLNVSIFYLFICLEQKLEKAKDGFGLPEKRLATLGSKQRGNVVKFMEWTIVTCGALSAGGRKLVYVLGSRLLQKMKDYVKYCAIISRNSKQPLNLP